MFMGLGLMVAAMSLISIKSAAMAWTIGGAGIALFIASGLMWLKTRRKSK
jgi:hypothetical protein